MSNIFVSFNSEVYLVDKINKQIKMIQLFVRGNETKVLEVDESQFVADLKVISQHSKSHFQLNYFSQIGL